MSERDPLAPVIDGWFDCSGITDPHSLRCEPFFTDGENGGTLLDGSTVHDILAAKARFSWRLNVMTPAQYAGLMAATEGGEVLDTVSAYVYDATIDAVRLAKFHVVRPVCRTVRNMGQTWAIPQSELVLEEAAPIARFRVTPPAKTVYDVGEALDLTGVTVTQYDRDGNASDITADCSFDPPAGTALSVPGAVPVAVLLPVGMTAGTFAVNVVATTYRVTPPTKTSYEIGEPLDLAGVAVTRRNSGGEADVTAECAFDPPAGTWLVGAESVPVGVSLGGAAIGGFSVSVVSSEIIASGDWWTLFNNGFLFVFCSGDMPHGNWYHDSWYPYRKSVLRAALSDSVTSITSEAFMGCTEMEAALIPDSVQKIFNKAFYGCSSLRSVIIPYGVDHISYETFYRCANLQNIDIPPSVTSIEYDVFASSGIQRLIVPGSVAGKNTSPTGTNGRRFRYCGNLTQVIFEEGVKWVMAYDFSNCAALTSVILPASLKGIDLYAFSGCSNLSDIYYAGTESQWGNVVKNSPSIPSETVIHYNSTGPT